MPLLSPREALDKHIKPVGNQTTEHGEHPYFVPKREQTRPIRRALQRLMEDQESPNTPVVSVVRLRNAVE